MKKLYNTPELNITMLTKLDTMTASGETNPDAQLRDRAENTFAMFSEL